MHGWLGGGGLQMRQHPPDPSCVIWHCCTYHVGECDHISACQTLVAWEVGGGGLQQLHQQGLTLLPPLQMASSQPPAFPVLGAAAHRCANPVLHKLHSPTAASCYA